MDYASRIIELRKLHGLSRKQLAQNTNLSTDGITGYELRRRKPALDALNSLADCFNKKYEFVLALME